MRTVILISDCPAEAILPVAVMLALAWIIASGRRGREQRGLFSLYALSVAAILLTLAGFLTTRASDELAGYGITAALVAFLALIMFRAARDLDRNWRRRLYLTAIATALLIIVGTLAFVPSIS